MAGASFRVEIEDQAARTALQRLSQRTGDLGPLLKDIGEGLLASTDARFDSERAPDGSRWAPLAETTILARMRGGVRKGKDGRRRLASGRGGTKVGAITVLAHMKILRQTGDLQDTLRYQVTGNELLLGTDRKHGATHQFGAPARGIPPRPFLGLSPDDRALIERTVLSYLSDA